MPQTLRTNIGQFSSSSGRWQPRAANVRAVEPAADLPSAQRGSLYVLAEVSGSGGGHAALYRQILNAAQAGFYEMGDTVDAALRQAVRNVHAVLRRANDALPEAAWRGGISLVVRYGAQLIIAQAGPALILVSHTRTVDQFPAELGHTGPALGGDERPEVQLYDVEVEAGSMVLLAQSDWPQQVTPEALAVAAAAADVTLASQYLGQLAGSAELSALLVGFEPDVPELKVERDVPLADRLGLGRAAAEPTQQERPTGKGLLSGAGKLLGLGRPGQEAAAEAPVVSPVAQPVEPADRSAGSTSVASVRASAEAATPAAGPSGRSDRSAVAVRPAPPPQPAWEPPDWPSTEPEASATELAAAAPRRSAWPLLVALVVIPVLIIAVVAIMLLMRGRAAEAQFVQLLDGANNVIAQAETMTDDAAAARHLSGGADYLAQARALRPDDPRLAEAQTRFDALATRVQHVTPLYGIVPLWTFKEPARQLERVVVSGDAVFVLDRGAQAVYRFTRSALGDSVNATEKPALRQGDQVGNVGVGELVDMAWSEAAGGNQRSRLLVLDAGGGLVSVDVTWGQERLQVGGRDKWVKPQLIVGYGGNLYVADVEGDQIWRYRPAESGYGDPEPYFTAGQAPDLAGLRAIAIDGNIWLLFADGRLLKYFGGEQRSFAWQGWPDALGTPTALAVALEQDRIFIADGGNGRIVEVNKDGKFLRQFRAFEGSALRELRSLFLDEAAGMFYILTNDQLSKANVPGPAAAPQTAPTN